MFGIFTNNHYTTFSLDDSAFFTHGFYRGSDFHCDRSFFIMRLLSAGPVGPWPGRLCHPSGSWESAGAPFSW